MNAYMKTISLYKEEGFEIKTSINPMHFSTTSSFIKAFSAYLPFTYIQETNTLSELSGGGG